MVMSQVQGRNIRALGENVDSQECVESCWMLVSPMLICLRGKDKGLKVEAHLHRLVWTPQSRMGKFPQSSSIGVCVWIFSFFIHSWVSTDNSTGIVPSSRTTWGWHLEKLREYSGVLSLYAVGPC